MNVKDKQAILTRLEKAAHNSIRSNKNTEPSVGKQPVTDDEAMGKHQKYLRSHISVLKILHICITGIPEFFPETYLDILSLNTSPFRYSPTKGLPVIKLLTRASLREPVNQ